MAMLNNQRVYREREKDRYAPTDSQIEPWKVMVEGLYISMCPSLTTVIPEKLNGGVLENPKFFPTSAGLIMYIHSTSFPGVQLFHFGGAAI
jgi:hypothetical protein